MELTVYKVDGKSASRKVKLDSEVFGVEPNNHAIYLDVKQYLANQRQGTHKAKERADIAGSTRKIKKQKGTGTARAGSIKSPLFKGGGRVFGPEPRDYGFKLNKKVKRLARKSALALKASSKAITILEEPNFEAPKTKEIIQILENLKVTGKKSLIVLAEPNKNVYLSARNLKGVKVLTGSDLNTYDLMNANHLIMSEGAVEKIQTILR